MKIKKFIARQLRRLAYAIHPETPATLPPGHKTLEVNAVHVYPAPYYGVGCGFSEDEANALMLEEADIYEQLIKTIAHKMANAGAIAIRRDVECCPAGREYITATAYVGIKNP